MGLNPQKATRPGLGEFLGGSGVRSGAFTDFSSVWFRLCSRKQGKIDHSILLTKTVLDCSDSSTQETYLLSVIVTQSCPVPNSGQCQHCGPGITAVWEVCAQQAQSTHMARLGVPCVTKQYRMDL